MHDIAVTMVGIILCLLLLRILNQSWTSVFRAIRLLLWFILPIYVLHLFLTPGELIWPESSFPFTWEGINAAMWLSTRLVLLFFSAMLLSRMLTLAEWQMQLCHLPIVGRRLYPYFQLFHPIRKTTIHLARKHWRENRSRGMSSMPGMMIDLLEDVLRSGHVQATRVWETWKNELPSSELPSDGRTWILAILGCCLPFLAWML